jgi:hypothetical protein
MHSGIITNPHSHEMILKIFEEKKLPRCQEHQDCYIFDRHQEIKKTRWIYFCGFHLYANL